MATGRDVGRDALALGAVVAPDADVAGTPLLHVVHHPQCGDGAVQVVTTLPFGREPFTQFLHLGDAGGAVVLAQLAGLGLAAAVGRQAGDLAQGHGLGIAGLAVGGEVEPAGPAPVDHLQQQMVLTFPECRLNLVLVGRHTAADVLGQDLPAVEPHLEAVVAAEEQRLRSHLAGGEDAVQVGGPKVAGQRLDGAVLPAGLHDPGLAVVAEDGVRGEGLFFGPEVALEGGLAIGLGEGADTSPRTEPKAVRPTRSPRPASRPSLLPCRLRGLPVAARVGQQRGMARLQALHRALQRLQVGRLPGRRHLDEGRGRIAVEPLLRDAVEEVVELVVLALGERVVLVVVALGALDGRAEEDRAEGVHPVGDVLVEVLVGVGTPLGARHAIAVEGRGHPLVEGGRGQQVAGKLVDDEPVEGLVGVEGLDDPVAVLPHGAGRVGVVAVAVGEPGEVEPRHRHALAIGLAAEQAVHEGLVGAGGSVGEEGVHLVHRGRQAGQVEGDAAQEGPPVGLRGRRQALALEAREDEGVDAVAPPARVRHRGRLRVGDRLVGPVPTPGRAFLDPSPQHGHLVGRQLLAGRGRRHVLVGIGAGDHLQQARLGRSAGDHGPDAGFEALGCPLGLIEAQAGLALGFVGPMALVAMLGQDRADLAVEVDRSPCGFRPAHDQQGRHQEPNPDRPDGAGSRHTGTGDIREPVGHQALDRLGVDSRRS